MADCFFCDDFVGEVNGDGGTQGYTIGKRDICKACLEELKYRLSQVEAKAPTPRAEKKLTMEEEESNAVEEALDEEALEEEGAEEKDPFSAKGGKV